MSVLEEQSRTTAKASNVEGMTGNVPKEALEMEIMIHAIEATNIDMRLPNADKVIMGEGMSTAHHPSPPSMTYKINPPDHTVN